jgi:aryl-alcohol dehydrogenase-like predicted oxidoreductase
MEYRHMGKSDLVVSAIGFGCWEMGGNYGAIDTQEVTTAIRRALDLGVTLFDTARGYGAGRSEEILGRALGADRKNVVVVTKCAIPTRPDQKPRRDARYDSIMKDVELSLQSLGTDYIDLLLVHWPDPDTPIPESMRALSDLRGAGKVRYVGVSNFSAAQLRVCKQFAGHCLWPGAVHAGEPAEKRRSCRSSQAVRDATRRYPAAFGARLGAFESPRRSGAVRYPPPRRDRRERRSAGDQAD